LRAGSIARRGHLSGSRQQGWLVGQDVLVQGTQLRARFQAEFGDHKLAPFAVPSERVGSAAEPV
jgi:hypothetical protein